MGKKVATFVQTHPYRLSPGIDGVSFRMADTVAQRLGCGRANIAAFALAFEPSFSRQPGRGHTSLSFSALLKRATGVLSVSRSIVEARSLLGALDLGGDFIVEQRGRETFLGVLELKRVEEHVADMLKDRLHLASVPLLPDVDAAMLLVATLVVVDEASMVDLFPAEALLDAKPFGPNCSSLATQISYRVSGLARYLQILSLRRLLLLSG